MPLGHITTVSPPDALGRTHHDAKVDSPSASPQLSGGVGFDGSSLPGIERPTRKSSLIVNPNSLVSKHISTFNTDPNTPISPPPTNAPRPLILNNNRASRLGTIDVSGATAGHRNFTSPLPISPFSPNAVASGPHSASSVATKPSPIQDSSSSATSSTFASIASASAVPVAIKRSTSSAGTHTNRSSPRSARFDLYRSQMSAGDRTSVITSTSGRPIGVNGPGTPVNRSPSSMNLPRDVSKKRIPSPLPLSASSVSGHQTLDSTSTLATPSPSMSSFAPQPTPEPPESVDVPALIASAGSPEAAIHKLLLEKQSASSHNSQLWRLVEKQRAMILGLNKDLERALKDKEKYRKKLKDHLVSSATLSSLYDGDIRGGNLDDIDESDLTTDSRMPSRLFTGSSTLSLSSSMPMHSTPMRAPFATPSSDKSASASKPSNTPKSANTDMQDDSLAHDYSIFKEQKALTIRKGPPAPLNLSPQGLTLPTISSGYSSEVSDSYSANDRGRSSAQESEKSPLPEITTLSSVPRARTRSPHDQPASHESPEAQRTLSIGSGTTSIDAASPQIAQVEAYQSLNSVNTVLLDSMGSIQKHLDRISLLPLSDDQARSNTSDHNLNPANIPRPLNFNSKSSPISPGVSLFPRSPQAPPQSRYSPTAAQVPRASSPQLSRPSTGSNPTQPLPATERIVSAPNVIEHLSASQAGIIRSPDGIYRGYMSDMYPGVLLPPIAISSVHVQVDSARLRPSRAATKHGDDQAIITLSVNSRPENICLWKVEKSVASLTYLEQQLKSLGAKLRFKMPDRNTFSGHSPARIDARRAALVSYFGQFLDNNSLSDSVRAVLSEFLSSDAVGMDAEYTASVNIPPGSSGSISTRSTIRKEGYLTKKGKNFGGWKARYFVLEGSMLNYYESCGGAHLGSIKLQLARIGRQTQPADMGDEEIENQYRHAFMVLEPKRQDPNNHIRHILCAETDEERDAWVFTLQYSDHKQADDKEVGSAALSSGIEESEPEKETPTRSATSGSQGNVLKKTPRLQKSMSDVNKVQSPSASRGADTLPSKSSGALRAVGYTDVVAAEAPIIGPLTANAGDPQPNSSVSSAGLTEIDSNPSTHPSISGPSNGTVIHENAETWGSKGTSSKDQPKERERKRSIFAFRGRSNADSSNSNNKDNTSVAQSSGPERLKIVFGAPLAAACELAGPTDVNVYLPAVLYRTIEFLHAKGALSEEGIFRMSGSSMAIKALRERFDHEGDVNLLAPAEEYHDIHTVASVLKLYLRELPANILTRDVQGDFLQAIDLEGDLRVQALNVLVNRLPRANREVLDQLSAFLKEIVDNEAVNKMSVRNVGIVFAPTLNIPAPLISLFVTDYPVIFGPPVQLDLSFMTAPPTPAGTLSIFPSDVTDPRTIVRPKTTGPTTPSYSNLSFPSLSPGPSSANNTVSSWEQQAKAAKEAFDMGYSRPEGSSSTTTTSSQSTATLASARHALHNSHSSSSIRAKLDRSKTDSPLSSHVHRMSNHENGHGQNSSNGNKSMSRESTPSGILNVSISQSPLLGAADLKREKSMSSSVVEGKSVSSSSSMLKTTRRKSGQFLMNVGILDHNPSYSDGGGNVSHHAHRTLRSWSSRTSIRNLNSD